MLYAVYSLTFLITHIIVFTLGTKCMGEKSQKKSSVPSFTGVGAKERFCVLMGMLAGRGCVLHTHMSVCGFGSNFLNLTS